MVYAADSKSAARKGLRVQVSSPAHRVVLEKWMGPGSPFRRGGRTKMRVVKMLPLLAEPGWFETFEWMSTRAAAKRV
jgi:hypothetical protein